MSHTAHAQEVFNMVLQSATRTVNSPTSNFTVTRVAQFKRTALTYLRDKAFEQSDSVKSAFLDTQAYCLSEFTTSFFNQIVHCSGDTRRQVIQKFMDASRNNPLWGDPDTETTHSFITANELTPFSLDTDWEKAFNAIKE